VRRGVADEVMTTMTGTDAVAALMADGAVPDELVPEVLVDERPWGGFRQYTRNQSTTVKLIEVAPGQRLSLQRHTYRDELWIVLDEGLEVRIGDRTGAASRGDEFLIPRGTLHRVAAGAAGGRFVEVCFGYFDEDDIERLDDAYGRS
jgi:mannose-6-phosphate isomerase